MFFNVNGLEWVEGGGTEWGRGSVKRGNKAIGQPHQTDRIYNYTDKIKLNNFPPFLIFLVDLERVPDRTIPDRSF